MSQTKNQKNVIAPKQDLRKIYFKNRSGSSMILFKDLTPYQAITRKKALKRIYSDWRGEFIISR